MKIETVVSSVLIYNPAGSILVFEDQDGFAALPGGSSEQGETPENTAIREALEETCLRVKVKKLGASYNLTVLNPDGTLKCKFRHHLFIASTRDSRPQPSSEWKGTGAECRWIKLKDLTQYKGVWPLPEKVRQELSEGKTDFGDLGELKYQIK
jgi:8-oxo-dGTP pyrophosphatase MutT (NUDIX family)